jgi:prepilin-type N-terminal cleavage/methylation domain-containing protein
VLQRLRAARQNEDGFTLIELLIVIVILGVLAGIVVFAVSGITDRGTVAACKADIKTVQVASEAYYAKNNAYAAKIDDTGHPSNTLVGAGLLQSAPSTDKYQIVYNSGTGGVTGYLGTGLTGTDCNA